jgi:hypothetical protein
MLMTMGSPSSSPSTTTSTSRSMHSTLVDEELGLRDRHSRRREPLSRQVHDRLEGVDRFGVC